MRKAKKHKVLIGRRNKEDTALGFLAKARESKSKPSDYFDLRETEKKIKAQ